MWFFPLLSYERAGGDLLSFLLPSRITVFENYIEKKPFALALTLGMLQITEN